MFLGENTHTLDSKGRVVLPSRYRARLEAGCVLATGQDGQLEIYPAEVYEAKARQMIEGAGADKEGRQWIRSAFRKAVGVDLDKAGRINLSAESISSAGLENEVKILGVFDHIELWNPAAYAADVARDRYREEDGD